MARVSECLARSEDAAASAAVASSPLCRSPSLGPSSLLPPPPEPLTHALQLRRETIALGGALVGIRVIITRIEERGNGGSGGGGNATECFDLSLWRACQVYDGSSATGRINLTVVVVVVVVIVVEPALVLVVAVLDNLVERDGAVVVHVGLGIAAAGGGVAGLLLEVGVLVLDSSLGRA